MSDLKKKVLFILPGGVGGAERMTLTIAGFLPKADYDVKFVIVGRKTDIKAFIPEDASVIQLAVPNKYCFTIIRILYLLMKEKPDILFSSIMYLNIRTVLCSLLFKTKVIIRNDNYISRVSRLTRFFMKMIYKYASCIIAQQEEMKDDIVQGLNVPADKVVVIHNPINKDLIDNLSQEDSPYENDTDINYLWIGNFLRNKGHDVLIKSFIELHKQINNAHLYLIGIPSKDIAYYKSLKRLIESSGLMEYVHFLGFQQNPYKWIKHCDCYVLPSRIEGLPNSLIEAMYLKKPVVATKCIPIISRMVIDGVNGYLVASEDTNALSIRMKDALTLSDCNMIYKPGEPGEFVSLFE